MKFEDRQDRSVRKVTFGMLVLYILLSAYNPLYRRNVLNTLYLPAGYTNRYRYTTGRNTEPDILEKLQKGYPVMFVFVDRVSPGGYRYFPLRRARFVETSVETDRTHLIVEMLDVVPPDAVQNFGALLLEKLSNPARLTGNDPENRDDGFYILTGPDLLSSLDEPVDQEAAWTKCVKELSKCEKMKTAEDLLVYCRVEILGSKGKPKCVKGSPSPCYSIIAGKNGELKLSYYLPDFYPENQFRGRLAISTNSIVRLPLRSEIDIASESDTVKIPLTSDGTSNGGVDVIKLRSDGAVTSDKYKPIILPDDVLVLNVSRPITQRPLIWLAALLFAVGTALGKVSLPFWAPFGISLFRCSPHTLSAISPWVGGAAMAGAVLCTYVAIGKKLF